MIRHSKLSDATVWQKIKAREIRFAGNKNLKIYGLLSCVSGKRMNCENRVFFSSEKEAIENGFRPCGHCLRKKYRNWKKRTS